MDDVSPLCMLAAQGFEQSQLLGSGAYGSVYAYVSSNGMKVAVKVALEGVARTALASEAEIMAAIPVHDNVLPLLSFHEMKAASVMVVPLANGGDTLRFMQDRSSQPLPELGARRLFLQLVEAVAHLHKHGFVHRDIKCENILLLDADYRHRLVLADFGFATRYTIGERLTETLGSLHYSSPEIVNQLPYEGPEVDVWSAGVVLYAWTTGRLPFGGATTQEITARITAASFAVPPTLSPSLSDLLRRLLCADASKRIKVAGIRMHPWITDEAQAAASLPRNASAPITAAPQSRTSPQQQQRRRRQTSEVMQSSARSGGGSALQRVSNLFSKLFG